MSRPVIGICTALERAKWSVWDQEAFLTPRSYVDAVHRAGGMALMLPPDPELQANPDEVLDLLDGLILAGGADIDPSQYGEAAHDATVGTVPERDTFEIALARRALDRDLPLLGICRGMQLMNVARGRHAEPARPGFARPRGPPPVARLVRRRRPRRAPRAGLAGFACGGRGAPRDQVRTTTRASSALGEGLRVTGWATIDELPEAIEAPDRRFALGVQWHPEADELSRVIEAFVREAAAGRPEPSPAAQAS